MTDRVIDVAPTEPYVRGLGNEAVVKSHKVPKVVAFAAVLTITGGGAAYAQSVSQAGQVVFYYGVSSGANAKSNDWSGGFTDRFCEDAPGATSNNTFTGEYRRVRTLQMDDIIKSHAAAYSAGKYTSASFSTSGSSKYHTDVTWSYVAGAGSSATGYSRGNGGC